MGLVCLGLQHAAFASLACTMACTMLEILFEALFVPILRLWWWWKFLWHVTRLIHDGKMWLGWLCLQHATFRKFGMHDGLHSGGNSIWSILGALFWGFHGGGSFCGILQGLIHAKIMWLGWLGLQHAALRNFGLFGLHKGMHNVGDSLWSFLDAQFEALMVAWKL